MPLLPLPAGGHSLAGGALPVTGAEDILREFPDTFREPTVAPVRDSLAEAFAKGILVYQTASARAAAQSDPTRATGIYLDLHGEDRDIPRRTSERDEDYRARLFATPQAVTPDALVAGINSILSTVTTKTAQLIELDLDGWFVHSSITSVWDSFVGAQSTYPDRLYEADADLNEGLFASGGAPGAAIPASGHLGRSFHLRIPALEGVDGITLAAVTGVDGGIFLFDGTEIPDVTQHIFEAAVTADEIYAAIVEFVQRFKGQGMTWSADVDPTL